MQFASQRLKGHQYVYVSHASFARLLRGPFRAGRRRFVKIVGKQRQGLRISDGQVGVTRASPRATRGREAMWFEVIKGYELRPVAVLKAHAFQCVGEERTAFAKLRAKHDSKLAGFVETVWSVVGGSAWLSDAIAVPMEHLRRVAV